MTFTEFTNLISVHRNPVVLLEGRRTIPDDMAVSARKFARLLALRFPAMRFRSGNAQGTDEAFSLGVADHDRQRMEFFLPYEGHRKATSRGAS